jgi:hypothetical protein
MIHSLTANIGQFGICNSLVHFFILGENVFTLDSKENYFRSRNLALPQDLHSLRRSTRDLWTVTKVVIVGCYCSCRRGETMSLNCGHQRTCCSSPT